ncbi:hypothetical protein GCM10010123_32240 [Pilimelia anulata]|uniref:Uncharacterized protein n=1 Tax=Pilimelia anulata TaxID=53371 RepID=A0A8J3FCE1_9ACTN|nr:hypothetical protein [Pilimelia anulata]GGJ99931.1 hypothetical protein GCM10010123_32240 [Pilimelia anulata]
MINYLRSEVCPQLVGSGGASRATFTAAAAFTEMAGWMAHDVGRTLAAERHFSRALDLARAGDDRFIEAHILASMSHLANYRRNPIAGMEYPHRALVMLADGPRYPVLEARLIAMQARARAGLRRPRETADLLIRAEWALAASPAVEHSQWVSGFDEGALAAEAARCMYDLVDIAGAERQAHRVVELRADDRLRSRAFGQLPLVAALLRRGEVPAACSLATRVLDATQHLGSFLVVEQLAGFRRTVEPHRRNTSVAAFTARLDEALVARRWLCHGPAEDGYPSTREEAW